MSADDLVKIPRPRLADWLMEPMRRNRSTYWKVALAAAFINIFGLLTALFTMTVYDRVLPNNATSSLIALSIGLGDLEMGQLISPTLSTISEEVALFGSTRS